MKNFPLPGLALAAVLLTTFAFTPPAAHAQGCVAAHSPQPIIAGLDPTTQSRGRHSASGFLHGLTVTTGYRFYNSYKHYIGTVYQPQRNEQHTAVVNHVNLFELDVNYQMTPRWSLIASVPGMEATRHGQRTDTNYYRSGGIGDVTVGVQAWVFRPPTENHGNINFSAQLKLPTGINDAKGTHTNSDGSTQIEPFDESIQPGDGTWDSAWPRRCITRWFGIRARTSQAHGCSVRRTLPAC